LEADSIQSWLVLRALLPSLFCCERVKLRKHFGDLGI
jgi:hypothetical protein